MKKIILGSVVFMALCLVLASCSKDSEKPKEETYSGTFKVVLDDVVLREGTTPIVGVVMNTQQEYVNTATMGDDEIAIVVNQFPRTIGATVDFELGGDPGLVFTYNKIVYTTSSGTFTRVSGSKISFEGMCKEMISQTSHTILGSVESEIFKVIE